MRLVVAPPGNDDHVRAEVHPTVPRKDQTRRRARQQARNAVDLRRLVEPALVPRGRAYKSDVIRRRSFGSRSAAASGSPCWPQVTSVGDLRVAARAMPGRDRSPGRMSSGPITRGRKLFPPPRSNSRRPLRGPEPRLFPGLPGPCSCLGSRPASARLRRAARPLRDRPPAVPARRHDRQAGPGHPPAPARGIAQPNGTAWT